MKTPRTELEGEIRSALKSQDSRRLATLRLLLAAVDNERIRSGREVDESTFVQLVQKSIKQRRESAEQYRAGDREDLARRELEEAEILSEFLPPQVDESEIRHAIEALIDEEDLRGGAAMGRVMKVMMSRFRGRADGAVVSGIAREILSQRS